MLSAKYACGPRRRASSFGMGARRPIVSRPSGTQAVNISVGNRFAKGTGAEDHYNINATHKGTSAKRRRMTNLARTEDGTLPDSYAIEDNEGTIS
jgi:hypothetical protein